MLFSLLLFFSFFFKIYSDCPNGVSYTNGICYKPFNNSSTWYQAESSCVQSGGHLLSISDVFLNTFIAGYADAEFHGADYWIGATTNYLGGGNWSWSDYNPFGYSNFVNEQSVNTFGYCASQNLPDGKWKNSSCTLQKPYICEYLPTKFCAPACPNGFTYYAAGEKCYKLLKPVNFTDGINQCKTLYDGNLASIHSKDETQFLTSVFSIDPNVIAFIDNNTTAYKRYVWIGLQDPTHTLNYTWIDGTSVDYTNWAYNEPDDANGIQHCGALQGVTISCLHHSFDNISVS